MTSSPGTTEADLRTAMRQWASGVCVVTAAHGGAIHGLTVSGFMSVSLAPPMVVACLNQYSPANALIQASGVFAVNVLAAHQRDISDRFAGRHATSARFDAIPYVSGGLTGCPLLAETVATLECSLHQRIEVADHRMYVGDVLGIATSDRDPLLYFRGDYREMIFGRRSRVRDP